MRPYMEKVAGHFLRFGEPQIGGVLMSGSVVQAVAMNDYKYGDVTATAENEVKPSQPEAHLTGDIRPFEKRLITGFFADVVELATRNTTLPSQFVYAIIKTLVGARCAGVTKFKTSNAEPRYYTALIGETGSGKGESWRRVLEILQTPLNPDLKIKIYDSADSGAGLKELFFLEPMEQPVLTYIDEVADLGFKSQAQKNPEILSTMLSLAEATTVSRVLANKSKTTKEARLCVVMCGQPDIYNSAFTGIRGGVLGWFDRLTPEFADKPSAVSEIASVDAVEAHRLHQRFNGLPYKTEIGMSEAAQKMIDDFWHSLPPEQRIARRRKNLIIDVYVAAFGRCAKEVEPSDVLMGLHLFERQQSIRQAQFTEEVPDRIGYFQAKIKKITERMITELSNGRPAALVRKTRREFERLTSAYRGNEAHVFVRAWAIFAPVYLVCTREKNKQGVLIEWFLPKFE